MKFDLTNVHALTSSIDINDETFNVRLKLFDVAGGQPRPSDFVVVVHPLSRSWDEGLGRDVGRFADIDVVNWLTASTTNGSTLWHMSGANAMGLLGSPDIDVISSGNLNDGSGVADLFVSQVFADGTEDLDIDVTRIVSATLAGIIPDCGFRVSYTSTLESDENTYFVKRFASRHVSNPRLRPQLIVKYDDSIRDDHSSFTFDVTGTLFLFNYVKGQLTNLVSGSAATQLTGSTALQLKLISGTITNEASQSYSATFDVDQLMRGDAQVSGTYFSSFAVSSTDVALRDEVNTVGSATFHVVWGSNDGTVPYVTSSLVVRRSDTRTFVSQDRQLNVTIPNHEQVYRRSSRARVRVNVVDQSPLIQHTFTRVPVDHQYVTFNTMYWRLVDVYTGDVVIPFDTTGTRLSIDTRGMYFDFWPGDLELGRVFAFEFMIDDGGETIIISRNIPTFRVEQ